jgi:hypothetical protein
MHFIVHFFFHSIIKTLSVAQLDFLGKIFLGICALPLLKKLIVPEAFDWFFAIMSVIVFACIHIRISLIKSGRIKIAEASLPDTQNTDITPVVAPENNPIIRV